MAMAMAPSLVAWPPMNPLAWIKMQPSMPAYEFNVTITSYNGPKLLIVNLCTVYRPNASKTQNCTYCAVLYEVSVMYVAHAQVYLGRELCTAQAAPLSRQFLARVEGVGAQRHGLDAPTAAQIRVQSVQHGRNLTLLAKENNIHIPVIMSSRTEM